jgi:hypothetical protein
MDRTDMLGEVLALLAASEVKFCAIGGVAVNAYTEPVVTLGLDLVLAAPDRVRVEPLLAAAFSIERFALSVNLAKPGSDLRVQLQTDRGMHHSWTGPRQPPRERGARGTP